MTRNPLVFQGGFRGSCQEEQQLPWFGEEPLSSQTMLFAGRNEKEVIRSWK